MRGAQRNGLYFATHFGPYDHMFRFSLFDCNIMFIFRFFFSFFSPSSFCSLRFFFVLIHSNTNTHPSTRGVGPLSLLFHLIQMWFRLSYRHRMTTKRGKSTSKKIPKKLSTSSRCDMELKIFIKQWHIFIVCPLSTCVPVYRLLWAHCWQTSMHIMRTQLQPLPYQRATDLLLVILGYVAILARNYIRR